MKLHQDRVSMPISDLPKSGKKLIIVNQYLFWPRAFFVLRTKPTIMREPSEKELLDGVNAKDISALRHLFEMYYAPLCFFTEKLIGRDLADDIIEDPFLKLLTENLHFESFKRLRAFLYDSAFNLCLHHIQDQPTKFNLLTEKRIKEDKELYVLKTEVVRLRALGRERA